MWKPTLAIAAMLLAGCASMSEWRTLRIDGSSESTFGESLSRLNDELPYSRRQILALALADIARTGVQNAGNADDGGPAYTDADFRVELNGLTYEDVIALADQSGRPISTQIYRSADAFRREAWAEQERFTRKTAREDCAAFTC